MFRAITITLVIVKLWLVSGQLIGALPIAAWDDGLYLKLALNVVKGDWLGPYDLFNLVKAPGYSLWIAANFFTGLPLHISQHIIYAGACALFAQAIKPAVQSASVRLIVFAVLLFQPMSFSTSTLRYVRDFLYTTQVLTIVSCLVAMLLRTDSRPRVLARWSLGLGLVGGFMWVTRDEGVVILPALGAAFALMAVSWWRRLQEDWPLRAMAAAAFAPVALSIVIGVSLINLRSYGFFGVSEFQAPELNAAMGALARVEPARHRRWVIVATETRLRIYPHSAAFRVLEAPLESKLPAWSQSGPALFEWDERATQEEIASGRTLGTICQEVVDWDADAMRSEIMTGWFVLALKEAILDAGLHSTPSDAMGHYAEIAREVNAACDVGLLSCGPVRSSLSPPWRWDDLGLTLRRTCRGAARLMTLVDIVQFPTVGSEEQLVSVRELTHDRHLPVQGAPTTQNSARMALDRWKIDRLANVVQMYAAVMSRLVMVAALSAMVLVVALVWSRRAIPMLGPIVVLLLALGARLGLLAYMDATAFPRALIPLYMLPLYPLMFAVMLLILIEAGRLLLNHGAWARRWPFRG